MDKFNATAWDYAKNRQLHYCQLIIMSHQRQRLVSNPTSPIPTGLGLMLNGFGGSFMNGDFTNSIDFDNMVCFFFICFLYHGYNSYIITYVTNGIGLIQKIPTLKPINLGI